MSAIADIVAREMRRSYGNPAIQIDVVLGSGAMGRAAVPGGASTGAHTAVELRGGGKSRFGGKGVQTAVASFEGEIFDAVGGSLAHSDRTANYNRLICFGAAFGPAARHAGWTVLQR